MRIARADFDPGILASENFLTEEEELKILDSLGEDFDDDDAFAEGDESSTVTTRKLDASTTGATLFLVPNVPIQ